MTMTHPDKKSLSGNAGNSEDVMHSLHAKIALNLLALQNVLAKVCAIN